MLGIFGQKKLVIFLKRNRLELYGSKGLISQLEFPQDIERYQEIINREKFDNLLSTFFTNQIIKRGQIVILLSEEITFQKTLDTSLDPQVEFQKFVATVPFDPGNLIAKQIAFQNQTYFVGTNKTVYEALVTVLKTGKNTVRYVVPSIIFDNIGQSINPAEVAKIFSNQNILKAANLLEAKAGQNLPVKTRIENIRKKSVTQVVLGVFAILLFATAATLIYLRYLKPSTKPVINYHQPIQIQNEATGEASPSATDSFQSTAEATSSP